MIEEQRRVLTIAELQVHRLEERCSEDELRHDGAQIDLAESRSELRLARIELAERDLRVAELEILIFERTSEFFSLTSRVTSWLRAVALRAGFPLVSSRNGVAAVSRHRLPRS